MQVRGFYCGVEPAVIKGAATNCIRFPVFGAIKRALQGGGDDGGGGRPLPPVQSALAGAFAGAFSAVVTHPIDTIMGNMQGLESGRYRNSLECGRALVRAGGVGALYHGLGTRVARVIVEMSLTFSLYEQVSFALEQWLD